MHSFFTRNITHKATLCLGIISLLFVPQRLEAEENVRKIIELNVERFESVSAKDKKLIQEWLIDLESTPLLAERLAVVVTGAYFTGGKMARSETAQARQFVFCWANRDGTKQQRVILRDESLLDPVVQTQGEDRFMQTNATSLDQLRLGERFRESMGIQVLPASKESRLNNRIRLAGVFYPIVATTATAMEWYRGSACQATSARVEIERLTGVYRDREMTIAEFYYQSTPKAVLHRFVVFRDGVPIQTEDRLAVHDGEEFRAIRLLDLSPEDLKQLKMTRQKASPIARTNAEWGTVEPDLKLPSHIRSQTISGPHSIEVEAKCVWFVNEEVKSVLFEHASVGKLAPLQLLE